MENDNKKIAILLVMGFLLTMAVGELRAQGSKTDKKEKVADQKKTRPRMDLAFCIDTTGSMQGELDMVKSRVKELVAQLASGNPSPDIRVGMVAFRDRGDVYVVKNYPFTDDIDQFVKDINELRAGGGGDGPEAVCEALHAAVNDLEWDASAKTSKLMFLIGDAGPHSYPGDYKWEDESRKAIARGIQINTIGCDGLQSFPGPKGVDVFKKIARLADGQFELLAYKQTITRGDGSRSVVVRAGGEAYELKSDAPASAWKKGAGTLMEAGLARKVSTSSISRARSRRSVGTMGAMGMSYMAESGDAASDAAGAAPAAISPVNRKDNNLDSILIRAAKQKASKDLKVDYSD